MLVTCNFAFTHWIGLGWVGLITQKCDAWSTLVVRVCFYLANISVCRIMHTKSLHCGGIVQALIDATLSSFHRNIHACMNWIGYNTIIHLLLFLAEQHFKEELKLIP